MVVATIDQSDVHGLAGDEPRRWQAAEPPTDDDHPVPGRLAAEHVHGPHHSETTGRAGVRLSGQGRVIKGPVDAGAHPGSSSSLD